MRNELVGKLGTNQSGVFPDFFHGNRNYGLGYWQSTQVGFVDVSRIVKYRQG